MTESYEFQFRWKYFGEQFNGLIRGRDLSCDGFFPLRREKQNIPAQISEAVQHGYLGAKRTVFPFLSMTLANSFTGPYVIQPA